MTKSYSYWVAAWLLTWGYSAWANPAVLRPTPVDSRSYAQWLAPHLAQYRVYALPTSPDALPAGNAPFLLRLQLTGYFDGLLHLSSVPDLWADDAVIRIVGEAGKTSTLPPPRRLAYSGAVLPPDKQTTAISVPPNASAEVRLCLDSTYCSGIIGNYWVIQALRDFVPQAPPHLIVVYTTDQVRTPSIAAQCGNDHSAQYPPAPPSPITLPLDRPNDIGGLRDDCTETIRLALLADYSMTTLAGSPEAVVKHLTSIVNAIQPAYEPIGAQFQISELYLSACPSCDPVSNGFVATNILSELTAWGESSNNTLTQPYDVAQFWTNRVFSQSDLVGLAHLGGLCTEKRYCQVRNYSPIFNRLRCLSAHELGHTINARHDATAGNIMYSVITEAATAFSAVSVDVMENCIANRPCLSDCSTCKGVAQLKLLNYTGSEADLVWTNALNPSYAVRYRPQGAADWTLLSAAYTDTVWHFEDLSPCLGYDFQVQANCAGGLLSSAQNLSIIGKRPTIYDIRTYNTDSAKVSWNNIDLPVRLRLRESGTSTWTSELSVAPPDTSYIFDGISPCSNYELSVRTECGGGLWGRDTLLSIRRAKASGVAGEALTTTTARMRYLVVATTSADITFTLRCKRSSSSFWLAEIPNAAPNTYYDLSGLQPCTPYEVEVQAYCGTTAGEKISSTFTTASLALLNPVVVNCNPTTQTYDLEVRLSHNRLSGMPFTVSAGGVTQSFTYSSTSPQTVVLTDIPNTGATTTTLALYDSTYPSLCSDDINYTPPPLVCACQTAFFENFDQCQLPCGWTSSNTATSNMARWRVGTTHKGNSIDSTCMAYFDDDHFDTDGGETVQLISPIIDLSTYSSATLSFDYNFHTIGGNFSLQAFNGTIWANVWQLNSGFCGFWGCPAGNIILNISPHLNAQFQLRWVYHDGNAWDWYAAIDNVEICGFSELSTCNAAFSYGCDTLCSNGDRAQVQLNGYGYGTFAASPAGLQLDHLTGEIDPATSTSGSYVVTYTTQLGSSTCTASRPITINSNCQLRVRPRLWLQGAYSLLGSMSTALRTANLLPAQQPYNGNPWLYNGTEGYATAANLPATTTDWILLELRDATYPDLVIARKAALLLNDGWVTDANAPSAQGVDFAVPTADWYYLAVRHRNHLAVMSSQALWLGTTTATTYDFGSANTQAFGAMQAPIGSNRFALYAGDADANGLINYADYNAYAVQFGSSNGYFSADWSLNKSVNSSDYTLYRPNIGRIGLPWLRE